MANSDPIGLYEATIDGVTQLLPQFSILDTLAPGQAGVTVAMVRSYILEITGRVDARLLNYSRLGSDAQSRIRKGAKDLVHNGAASYAQAARFPEQSTANSDGYAGVLWARFTTGLNDLAALLEVLLDQQEADKDDCETERAGVSASFPVPVIDDHTRW